MTPMLCMVSGLYDINKIMISLTETTVSAQPCRDKKDTILGGIHNIARKDSYKKLHIG